MQDFKKSQRYHGIKDSIITESIEIYDNATLKLPESQFNV